MDKKEPDPFPRTLERKQLAEGVFEEIIDTGTEIAKHLIREKGGVSYDVDKWYAQIAKDGYDPFYFQPSEDRKLALTRILKSLLELVEEELKASHECEQEFSDIIWFKNHEMQILEEISAENLHEACIKCLRLGYDYSNIKKVKPLAAFKAKKRITIEKQKGPRARHWILAESIWKQDKNVSANQLHHRVSKACKEEGTQFDLSFQSFRTQLPGFKKEWI